MPDDLGGEAIESLAVKIVGDASPLLETVENAVEETRQKLAALGEPIPEVTDAFDGIVDAMVTMLEAQGTFVSPEVIQRLKEVGNEYLTIAANTKTAAEETQAYTEFERQFLEVITQAVQTGRIRGNVAGLPGAPAEPAGTEEAAHRTDRLGQAQERTARSTRNWLTQAFSLEGILKKLGMRILGVVGPAALLFKGIQMITREIKESIKAAIAYDTAMFRLEVAVRAAQRAMGESAGTIHQWVEAAREIAHRYGLYTETAMLTVAASVRRMTLQFEIAADDAIALTDAGVALATVFGEQPGGVAEALARFVATGTNQEALRQFGINASNVALQAEAMRLGFQGLYRDLTQLEQAEIRQSLVLRQVGMYSEDAAAAQETLAGETAASTAMLAERAVAVGAAWMTFRRLWQQIWTVVRLVVQEAVGAIGNLATMMFMGIVELTGGTLNYMQVALEHLMAGTRATTDELRQAFAEGVQSAGMNVATFVAQSARMFQTLEDEEDTAARHAKETTELMAAAWVSLGDVFNQINGRLIGVMRQLDTEYKDALNEIDEAAIEERQRRTRDYQRDTERELQEHLLRMRRMEEDYLLELEDAVRARDARQVLLLMRRHRIDVRRAEEDYQLRRGQRLDDYRQELADMEDQAARRRAEITAEWQERRAQAQREHEEYARQLIEQWIRENGINQEGLKVLHGLLLDEFGPGGWQTILFEGVTGMVNKVAMSVQQALKSIAQQFKAFKSAVGYLTGLGNIAGGLAPTSGPVSPWGAGTGAGGNPYTGYQAGGDFVATGPRTIRVGEGRPEAVSIRPLSGAAPLGAAAPARGRMEIDLNVKADPRLIVEASEAAMSEVADVFINITRVSRETQP